MGNKRRTRIDHSALAELATRQHGVVATRQLRALGISRFVIADAARYGRAHRLYRGVYAVGHEKLSWKGQCSAAVLACAPAAASYWSAAWLWGLATYRPSRFDLTVPSRRGHRRRQLNVHYAALGDEDLAEVDAIPVTSVERTHLDLAASHPRSLPKLLERAEEIEDEQGRRLFDLRRFESLLARTRGHAGHKPLSEALTIYRPDPTVLRSDLEKRFRALLRASSLPLPSHNVNVGPYELDCYWLEHSFCVELDTYGTHGSRRSFEEDRRRQRELRRLGIEVERVTDLQLRDEPGEVLAALAVSLERRRPA
ncbi:MAG: type IV toxin-antitoxin system AbiEi family antitoxin domain-containing protein [Actinobacteria bacterium]|nr:type IV toxin-antitoxin system AbiEi family antitoxin domain-containing protein [Actinomycetota bacterium]